MFTLRYERQSDSGAMLWELWAVIGIASSSVALAALCVCSKVAPKEGEEEEQLAVEDGYDAEGYPAEEYPAGEYPAEEYPPAEGEPVEGEAVDIPPEIVPPVEAVPAKAPPITKAPVAAAPPAEVAHPKAEVAHPKAELTKSAKLLAPASVSNFIINIDDTVCLVRV